MKRKQIGLRITVATVLSLGACSKSVEIPGEVGESVFEDASEWAQVFSDA